MANINAMRWEVCAQSNEHVIRALDQAVVEAGFNSYQEVRSYGVDMSQKADQFAVGTKDSGSKRRGRPSKVDKF